MAGIAIALGLIPYGAMEYGIFGNFAASDMGWLGIIAAIALAFGGAIYQVRSVSDMSAAISADSYMNPGIDSMNSSGGTPA